MNNINYYAKIEIQVKLARNQTTSIYNAEKGIGSRMSKISHLRDHERIWITHGFAKKDALEIIN